MNICSFVLVDCSDSSKRIHRKNSLEKKYDKSSQNEVISTRKIPEISEKLLATTSEFGRTYSKSKPYKKIVPRNFHLQESVPFFIPSISNGISKEITLNNKDKTGQELRPHRKLISKSSAKIPTKRFHLHESIPSFLPSFPNDISKQTLQIPNVKLPTTALKASSKGQKTSMCQHKVVLRNVRLKHGRKLATFELRGRVASIVKCVEKCCRRHWCNVAYKVGSYCYSVHCPTDEACEPVKMEDAGILSDYVLLDRPQNMNYSKFNLPISLSRNLPFHHNCRMVSARGAAAITFELRPSQYTLPESTSLWLLNLVFVLVKGAVSRFYCASKICANLKNCLPTINQVRSEIRYTIYNPFVMQTSLLCFKN